jgi:hypothetical protein
MTFEEFKASLQQDHPPENSPVLLEAMWWDKKDAWHQAHDIAQDIDTNEGAWVHAYLHRKEGDPGNAAYWYRRAGKNVFHGTLEEEWDQLVRSFLQ